MGATQFTIAGLGVVGAFGSGRDALREKLRKCNIQANGSFYYRLDNRLGPLFADTARLSDFLPAHLLRRTDHFSKMALAALFLALDDAGLQSDCCKESGLILATGYGPIASIHRFVDSFIDNGPLGASPTIFAKAVHNQAAAHIAMHLGLHGPTATVCQHSFPFHHALLTACLWLQEKRVERVIVGGLDEFPSVLEYCYRRYRERGEKTIYPEWSDSTITPGEGAALFVLEPKDQKGKLPSLEMPFLGSALGSENLRPKEGESLVVGGAGPGRRRWLKTCPPDSNIYNFRGLYGWFPTAGALDLAAMTVLLPERDRGACIEIDNWGQCAHLQLRQGLEE